MQKRLLSSALPYLLILVGVLVLFALAGRFPPVRVGDGSEYYGLYYAWAVGHRPWMMAPAYEAYAALAGSGQITGLVTREALENAFPALRVAASSDFNHFWFYSLLAWLCGKVAGVFGAALTAHASFLLLHLVALAATMMLGYRHHGVRGVLAVALMVLASPLWWFIDKAHTEFLTVCLVLSGVILVMARRYAGAALLIALASTQNPSFALVAAIPLFYRVVLQRERSYSFFEVALCVLTVLAVLAHPVYYFSRYGVVTPQLLAGGASMGSNLSTFYVWIVDPDVGLLPNWPLGAAALLVLLGAWAARRYPKREGARDHSWTVFAVLYLAINFYAHSSTVNLNSGATPGLARYALWYLPLAFPLFLHLFALFPKGTKRFYAGLVALAALCAVSLYVNDPRKPEQFSEGSLTSRLIQTRLPSLYNPPYEIFVERYSGVGEGVGAMNLRAVFGPDCAKMIVIPGAGRANAIAPAACMFDQDKLNAYVNTAPQVQGLAATAQAPGYTRLPDAAGDALLRVVPQGVHGVGAGADGGAILGEGWSGREDWGAWSEKPQATLLLSCPRQGGTGMELVLKLRPFREQSITISDAQGAVWKGPVDGSEQGIRLQLKPEGCVAGRHRLVLDIPNATSPMALGLSGDARQLGVGLSSYELRVRQGGAD